MRILEDELIGLIYESIVDDDAWPTLMSILVDKLKLRSASVTTLNTETNQLATYFEAGAALTQKYLDLYTERFAKEDMLLRAISDANPGTFVTSNTHFTRDEILASNFYQQWALPQGICNGAAAMLCREGKWSTMMMMLRGEDHPEFTAQDVALFQQLAPHFNRAIQLRGRVLEMRDDIDDLRALIERFPLGVMVFDEYGRVGQANELALKIIEQHPSLQLVDKRLVLDNSEESRVLGMTLINAIHASLGLKEYSVESMHLQRAGDSLTLVINPFRVKESDRMTGRALVMFYSPRFSARPSATILAQLYRLTTAEANLCCELVSGATLEEVAAYQNKKKETLRSHLKSIFSKTGTSRQAELVAQILTSPAMIPQL